MSACTSSSLDPAPGYVIHELINATYADPKVGSHLARHMSGLLADKALKPAAKLKTLKTLNQMSQTSSRAFRMALRDNDQYLRAAASQSVTERGATENSLDLQIREVARVGAITFSVADLFARQSNSPFWRPEIRRFTLLICVEFVDRRIFKL